MSEESPKFRKINLMHAVLDMDIGGLQRLIAETTMVTTSWDVSPNT